ncbi:MAG: glycosyltransferase, partial [Pyrinomonadaceae bacterium]
PVVHICQPTDRISDNLDNLEVGMRTPEFDTICEPMSDELIRTALPKRSVALASVGEEFNTVSRICRQLDIPSVYITENSLKTRNQMASETQRGPVHGAWRRLREVRQEIRQRKAISIAAGVQCNGLPTFTAYNRININAHLFFDNRIDASMVATDEKVQRRSLREQKGKKLRLAFSGRLTPIKGVDDLLTVAEHLRSLVSGPFELSICGDGEYGQQLRRDIQNKNLGEFVKMRGVLDFKSELVPFVTDETDIFICCHRQGDPSCTYLETMACGVPIVGYANEAWSLLSAHSGTGWVTPLGNPWAMAEKIAGLERLPETIQHEAAKSLRFAENHIFEKTFRGRIEHLKSLV